MGESYITTVRAIGFPQRILMHYALRNALLPVGTVLGLQLGLLLTGAVLTESVFSWPGLGRLIYDAILARDTPVIMERSSSCPSAVARPGRISSTPLSTHGYSSLWTLRSGQPCSLGWRWS